jgi:hypothetical protein
MCFKTKKKQYLEASPMPVIFYPQDEDIQQSLGVGDRLEILMEAASRYKSASTELNAAPKVKDEEARLLIPREIKVAYNWQEIAKILREIRELPEGNPAMKSSKADRLLRLSEIYEVLRSAKMPKLEAVRIALVNESNSLRTGTNPSPSK